MDLDIQFFWIFTNSTDVVENSRTKCIIPQTDFTLNNNISQQQINNNNNNNSSISFSVSNNNLHLCSAVRSRNAQMDGYISELCK